MPHLHRPLFAALVSARLQARKAVLDAQEAQPTTPTLYLILPCVTINRPERDTEILCGVYSVDCRAGGNEATYVGLGDDPTAFRIERLHKLFVVTDENVEQVRQGRDHRALARQALERQLAERPRAQPDERLKRLSRDVAQNKHRHHHHASALLRAALPIVAEIAPIPAAVLMFADGAIGIHHTFKIHRLAREMEGSNDARQILAEVHARIDRLSPDEAEALIELLLRDYTA